MVVLIVVAAEERVSFTFNMAASLPNEAIAS